MGQKEKIKLYALIIVSMVSLGAFVMLLVFIFTDIALSDHTTVSGFYNILMENNQFYLLWLAPFLSGIAGIIIAGKRIEKIHLEKQKEEKYNKTLDEVIRFADKIGSGDLSYSFRSLNGETDLADTLESMRNRLLEGNRKETDKSVIVDLVAELNELLRPINELSKLTAKVTMFIVNRLDNIVQGAFYTAEESKDKGKSLQLSYVYAYDRKKYLEAEYSFAEGLVGQAAVEKDIIHLTEIPENYISITSGLIGHAKPRSIMIIPLMNNEKVEGVLELASINKFTDLQIRILSEFNEIIARTIHNVKINEKTILLLRESEEMSKELEEQKQQLLQNADEMIRTQQELEKSNVKLEEQMQAVDRNNRKSQLILENSLEIIFIYTSEGDTMYVSPSVSSVLGYYPDDLVGKKEVNNIHPLDAQRFKDFIKEIISFPEKIHKIQYRYFTKSGEILWLEAIGKNLLADVIQGIVINARDISEQRLAQKEQRRRAKMQALSENSLDLIIRIDIFSRCTYINPIIEDLTGAKAADFNNKPISESGLGEEEVRFFKHMIDEVSGLREKKIDEMIMKTLDGEKVMEVSAIPEFLENGEIESVLFVCHDITEARNREELLNKKNKSIRDSINYAYYIQGSLMPTQESIQKHIPNSFMIYKPKDIVSGDYPFLHRDGDNVYIGVMDCTGHGVPGALMSIIGYFLQSEILSGNNDDNAGQVLDKLHANVVKKLRQDDPDSKINDGMDASFCKIDLKNKIFNYAGAHRPLYYVKNGVFTEIRGDKYPVGSTQYTNRSAFVNHEIKISPGDAFYMMSDGYPDQFGGPTGKQKFLSGRVNLLIKENTGLSIFQMRNLFEQTYNDWKGDVPQVDDVLLIGLKF